jgi:hypothetical protein
MTAVGYSEILVPTYQNLPCHNAEVDNMNFHLNENLNAYIYSYILMDFSSDFILSGGKVSLVTL